MLRITSTVGAYLELLQVPAGDARVAAWTAQYEAAHSEIFEVYYQAWGKHERRSWAADQIDRAASFIGWREKRTRQLVEETVRNFTEAGYLHASDDLRVVRLVGGRTSNGWVTELAGQPALFLALEFLGEEPSTSCWLSMRRCTWRDASEVVLASRARSRLGCSMRDLPWP
jgi:hypothetical protein